MTLIDQLNRKLGDALGYVRGGTEPRFMWKWAPDIPYWGKVVGPSWVLCQWGRPQWSRYDWKKEFGDRYPYPANGMHHAHPETALERGQLPNEYLTQNYIWALDIQMETSYEKQLISVNDDLAAQKERDDIEWIEFIQNTNPAFSNFDSGKRGGHVSYGGV